MFFYPKKQLIRTPADVNLPYEDVYFTSLDQVSLHGWFLPAVGEAFGTVIFFHGNAENISTHLGAVYWLPNEGFNVFLFDYRGYGQSQGKAEIQGVHWDAVAALDYVRQRPGIDGDKLVFFGQSLGAAIAIYTAATQNKLGIQALIVESPFASYRSIFREKLAAVFLTWPFQWPLIYTVEDAYSPLAIIGDIEPLPILFIHGDQDRTIPLHHSQQLYQAVTGDKQFWVVKGGRHIETLSRFSQMYRPRFVDYLKRKLEGITKE